MKVRISCILVLVVALTACFSPAFLGVFLVPVGEGPDEFSHIDHSFFKLTHPDQTIDVEKGFYAPGYAPLCQGHQPGLSYWLNARLLSFFHSRKDHIGFVDYLAGVSYSSEGGFFGGIGRCSYRDSVDNTDQETRIFQISIRSLRLLSVVFFGLSGIVAFYLGRVLFPKNNIFAFSLMLFYFSIPNAIWRSIFVTNDNLPALCGALVTLFGTLSIVTKSPKKTSLFFLLAVVSAGLGALSKYTSFPLLPAAFVALLLGASLSPKHKLKVGFVGILIYLGILGPALVQNYLVDGDILSSRVLIHLANFLYFPSSHLDVIFNQYFLKMLIERIWVEYHDLGAGTSRYFPVRIIYAWWIVFVLGLLGTCIGLMGNKISTIQKKCLLFYLAMVILSIGGIIHFATSFPLPGGRYFHPALLALCACIIIGIQVLWPRFLFRWLPLNAYMITFAILCFGVGQMLTFGFLANRFRDCHVPTRFEEVAGATVFPIDLNGDGKDEVGIFHRIRNRIFFVEEDTRGSWTLNPELTRYIGLVADRSLSFDVTGDKKGDLVQWRPGARSAFMFDANVFLSHNEHLSRFRDFAVENASMVGLPMADSMYLDRSLVNGNVLAYSYDRFTNSWWKTPLTFGAPNSSVISSSERVITSGPVDVPLFIHLANDTFLGGVVKETGDVFLTAAADPSSDLHFKVSPSQNFMTLDLASENQSEILSWKDGERCFEINKLVLQSKDVKVVGNKACYAKKIPPLSSKLQIVFLKGPDYDAALFERESGFMWFLDLDSVSSDNSIKKYKFFNPGWVIDK